MNQKLESDKENRRRDQEDLNKKLDQNNEELKKQMKESIEFLNDQIESNHEDLKRSQEALEKKSEELKKQIKKDLEIVNQKMENNHDILQRKIEEESEKNRQELRFMFVEFREEDKRTKTGMNKRWEETSYPVDQLQETLVRDFKPRNETLDSTSESIKETLNENRDCLLYTSRCV